MNFTENLRLAWSCVKSNKMRSILTMLGIIIGISAVITISTLGASLRQTISSTYSDMMSTNQIALIWYSGEDSTDEEPPVKFNLENTYEMKKAFAGQLESIMLQEGVGAAVYKNGEEEKSVNVNGCSEGYCSSNKYEMLLGRDVEYQDSFENRKVCVVSDNFVKYALNGEKNPIGKRIELDLHDGSILSAYIIGVYKLPDKMSSITGQGNVSDKDKVTDMIIPISYAWELMNTPEEYRENYVLYVNASGSIDNTVIKDNITNYMESKKEAGSHYSLYIESLEEQLKMISGVLDVITVIISVIAAISLLVGGIGVMNIMLVSVVERTKEIGIRKALGAKNKVIESQFLVESVLICAIGGISGIVLGLINGGVIGIIAKAVVANSEEYSFLSVNVNPPIGMIIISFLFSTLVGVIFGLYPARRAARLSPIDALRYE